MEYKPYGEISSRQSPSYAAGFAYAGARQDEMTGLQDFGARFYDPTLGRFLSLDPIVADALDPRALNPYGYGLGNPISFVDVGGYSAFPALAGFLVGAAVTAATNGCVPCGSAAGGAVSGALAAQENGGDEWKGALVGGAIGAVTGWGLSHVGEAAGGSGSASAGETAGAAAKGGGSAAAAESTGHAAGTALSQSTLQTLHKSAFEEFVKVFAQTPTASAEAVVIASLAAAAPAVVQGPQSASGRGAGDDYLQGFQPSYSFEAILKGEPYISRVTVAALHPTTELVEAGIVGLIILGPSLWLEAPAGPLLTDLGISGDAGVLTEIADVTAAGSRYANIATKLSPQEFQSNLVSSGYKIIRQTTGMNGPVTVLSNGAKTYTIYTSTSTGAASAQVTNAAGEILSKIRFGGP
jgi:RHS repeat-associated protein